jgi:hypothetical protein
LIPALGRQRDRGRGISEFEASLVYKVSSRTARAIQRNSVLKKEEKKKKKIKLQGVCGGGAGGRNLFQCEMAFLMIVKKSTSILLVHVSNYYLYQ